MLGQGMTLQQVADELEVHLNSVEHWKRCWIELGLVGLYEGHHSGRPPALSHKDETALRKMAEKEGGSSRLLSKRLHQFLRWRGKDVIWSVSDNPRKNTLDYLCVQAQKAEFLSEAARGFERADIFVWVDFGIFHLPGMTEEIIVDFMRRAKHETMITIPGCWDRSYEYNDDHPCWRFCGGVMIVPRQFIFEFETAWKMEYMRWINETDRLSWEVNCLARMEMRGACLLNCTSCAFGLWQGRLAAISPRIFSVIFPSLQ